MDEDDYESLPADSPMQYHMIAGCCAGILEHCIMYPVDSVKTRLQCIQPVKEANYRGLFDGLIQISRREGIMRSMRGIGAVVGGAGPAHALYFASYEKIKSLLSQPNWGYLNTFSYGIAGLVATLFHDAIMTPADAVKQRVQMYNSPYNSSLECISKLLKYEGPSVLYRAYLTQLMMNIPHQCIHFIVYEATQDLINKERVYNPLSHIICGALAGGAGVTASNPLDVCKTLLNTQEQHCGAIKAMLPPGASRVQGIVPAVNIVYRTLGFSGFFRGWQARVVFSMPGTAISWLVYEYFKHTFLKKPIDSSESSLSITSTAACDT